MEKTDSINGDSVMRPLVSIIIPAYNEASIIKKNLTILYEYLENLEDRYEFEIIVVNDGSTDRTGEIAESFSETKDNFIVLHHSYNFRLGQALRYAFNNCNGDYVVVIDIDLSYSPEHIEKMLTAIANTGAKIVIASPYMKGGKVSNIPWLRKMFSKWANRFLAFFARDRFFGKLTTLTGMVRAYDREFLSRLDLKAMDFDIMPEIIYKAMVLRARIVEIPAHLNWRSVENGKSSGKKRKSSIRILRSILASFISGFMFRPFMFFLLPGLGVLILSAYPFAWILIHAFNAYRDIDTTTLSLGSQIALAIGGAFEKSPHAFIVGGVALMVGIQFLSLAFLALQNKRNFEELFHLTSMIYRYTRHEEKKKD